MTLTLPDGRQLVREWHAGDSYLASGDPRFHFGLGDAELVSKMTIRWPDGRVYGWKEIQANQILPIPRPD